MQAARIGLDPYASTHQARERLAMHPNCAADFAVEEEAEEAGSIYAREVSPETLVARFEATTRRGCASRLPLEPPILNQLSDTNRDRHPELTEPGAAGTHPVA